MKFVYFEGEGDWASIDLENTINRAMRNQFNKQEEEDYPLPSDINYSELILNTSGVWYYQASSDDFLKNILTQAREKNFKYYENFKEIRTRAVKFRFYYQKPERQYIVSGKVYPI